MKLRNKEFILTGLSLAFIFALYYLYYIDPARNALLIFIPIVIVLTGLFLWLFDNLIIRRIKKLNNQLTEIQMQKSTLLQVDALGNDELSDIGTQVNVILNNIERLQAQLDEKLAEERVRASLESTSGKKIDTSLAQQENFNNLVFLPKRVLFNEILNKAINQAGRHKNNLAILIIDIDAVKEANSSANLVLNDCAINEISNRLIKVLRKEDIVAKLDGNEFIILLNDINKPKFASAVAEKILKVCSPILKIDSHEVFLKVSIGISIYPNDGHSLEDIIETAYNALSKAKSNSNSQNAYQFYSEALDIEGREYVQFDRDLRKAIQDKNLMLYYQPKLHLKNGNIVGVEALLRWIHPSLGVINPTKFISIAEDAGLINQIGEWTLYEACQTNKHWQNEGYEHITVALNLSSKQFNDPHIVQTITKVLNETGLSPNYLELEITESTVMSDLKMATKILDEIKATGVQISIDHFGMGYTSISHLKHFPISIVKIDQNFIKGIPNNQTDVAITNAIIGLAHNLGLKVVAEGVETASQVQHLDQQHCDMVQGYFLSYPIPAENIVQQFKKLTDKVMM